jgi:hypothetical protein
MSRTSKVRHFFGDGEHDFQLNIGELVELEEDLNAGAGLVRARLAPGLQLPFGEARVKDIRTVLRLGLVGGGMPKERAWLMIERHVRAGDLGECALLAYVVVSAALAGAPEEALGERKGRGQRAGSRHSRTAAPAGRSSTSAGGALGLSPAQVDASPLWKFLQVVEGFRRANSLDPPPTRPPTLEEHRARLLRLEQRSIH